MRPSTVSEFTGELHAIGSRASLLWTSSGDPCRPQATGGWSIAQCLTHLTLSTFAYLPAWREAVENPVALRRTERGPLRLDAWGKLLTWFLEPPPKIRFRTKAGFEPSSSIAALEEFLASQRELCQIAEKAENLAIDRIRICSAYDRRVRYSIWSSFVTTLIQVFRTSAFSMVFLRYGKPVPAIAWMLLCAVVAGEPARAQEAAKRPRILLYFDMEGLSGIDRQEMTTFTKPEAYRIGREMLTEEVNAAIRGLMEGGAGSIRVVDAHASGNTLEPDILLDKMDKRATFEMRDTEFSGYRDMPGAGFDAIVCVGMHARGRTLGFLAHTFTWEPSWRVNSRDITEIIAHFAAPHGVPVVMVSGDDVLQKQIAERFPGAEFGLVKRARGRAHADLLPLAEARANVEAAARRAVAKIRTVRPFAVEPRFEWELGFQNAGQADRAAVVAGVQRASETSVKFSSRTFREGYNTTTGLIRQATAERMQVLVEVVRKHPDGQKILEDWQKAILDRFYDEAASGAGSGPGTAAGPGAAKRRYWGAQ